MKSATYKRNLLFAPLVALLGAGVAGAGDMAKSTISAGKLAKDADKFYGQTVTVRAEVEDMIGTHSFTLDEDAILAGADVLVLVPSASIPAGLKKDDVVLVTGTVRKYVTREFEKDYDWFKDGEIVKSGVKVDYDTRPVLVATSVRLADASAAVKVDHSHHAMTEQKPAPAGVITAGKLARDGKKYYGQTVTVKAEVEDVIDNRTFTLDEDSVLAGADVLVLVPAGVASTLRHDEVVTVTGTVRPYVMAELEKDYDWFKDGKLVKIKETVDLKTRPVIVATSVRTAAGAEVLASN